MGKWLVIFDPDIHGGISALLAIKCLRSLGEKVLWYSHIEPPERRSRPLLCITTSTYLPHCLHKDFPPGSADTFLFLDIAAPTESVRLKPFFEMFERYVNAGQQIIYIDHHESTKKISQQLRHMGVEVFVANSSLEMSLEFPRMLCEVDDEMVGWALIGALADQDTTIAHMADRNVEFLVLNCLDWWWKAKTKEYWYAPDDKGAVGIVLNILMRRFPRPEDLLAYLDDVCGMPPLPRCQIIGDVIWVRRYISITRVWRFLWYVCFVFGKPFSVTYHTYAYAKKIALLYVYGYWRNRDARDKAEKVSRFLSEKYNTSLLGHYGAKMMSVPIGDAKKILMEAVKLLNS